MKAIKRIRMKRGMCGNARVRLSGLMEYSMHVNGVR